MSLCGSSKGWFPRPLFLSVEFFDVVQQRLEEKGSLNLGISLTRASVNNVEERPGCAGDKGIRFGGQSEGFVGKAGIGLVVEEKDG